MSTNYYAFWTPPGASSVTVRLHICKNHSSFSGLMFDSWSKWKEWLTYQQQPARMDGGGKVVIRNEFGMDIALEDFIRDVEETNPLERARQTTFVKSHHPDMADWQWLDEDGFSFFRGEFF